MILILLAVSSLISILVALVLGIRLLLLASRTHGIPELAMGVSFILGGFFGFVFIMIGNAAAGTQLAAETSTFFFRLGMSLLSIGVCGTYVFVWQTFRPDSSRVRNLTFLAIVCIILSLWSVWSGSVQETLKSALHLFGEFVRLGAMVWGCSEALHYYTVMRRRQALDLADAVVTNRFLLWGIAMGAGIIVSLAGMYMTLSGMVEPDAWPYLILAIFAAVSPIAQWLAFFPPRAYREWIDRSPLPST